MKTVSEIRESMAEKGFEYTPEEIKSFVNQILKLRRQFRRHSDCFDLTLEERQALRTAMAERGEEITLAELDELVEIGNKIKNLPW